MLPDDRRTADQPEQLFVGGKRAEHETDRAEHRRGNQEDRRERPQPGSASSGAAMASARIANDWRSITVDEPRARRAPATAAATTIVSVPIDEMMIEKPALTPTTVIAKTDIDGAKPMPKAFVALTLQETR